MKDELLSIADQLRRLDIRHGGSDYPAGRVLQAAIDRGAFSGIEYVLLRNAVASVPPSLTFRMAVGWFAGETKPPPQFCEPPSPFSLNPGNEWRKINFNAFADLIEREADSGSADSADSADKIENW